VSTAIVAAAAAAVAAAASVVVPTRATATAAAAATTATAATRRGLVHAQRAVADLVAVEAADGRVRLLRVGVLGEAEAARVARLAIVHDPEAEHGTNGAKYLLHLLF